MNGETQFLPQNKLDSTVRDFHFKEIAIVLAVAWLARLNFIFEMPDTAQSFDVNSWRLVAAALVAGENPYHTTEFLNWPPLWPALIFLISKISPALHVDFFRSLQFFLILVESAVIILIARLIRQIVPTTRIFFPIVLGIALNPIAILQVCEHCNFDVIVALWLLLFMLNLLRYNRTNNSTDWLCACLFLGLGILTKTVPLILIPLLAGGFRCASRKIKFLGILLLTGPVALGMSIIFALAPADVIAKVIEYRSKGGYFGISGLFHLAGLDSLTPFYNAIFYAFLFTGTISVAILFWRRQFIGERETILLAALLLAAIPALGPGYAPQYIYWFMPFLVTSFVCFKGKFRFALSVFAIVAICTYLVEYAFIGAYGMFLMKILAVKNMNWGISLIPFATEIQKPTGATLLRLPLFAAYLALLVVGINTLRQSLKTSDKKSD